VSECGDCHGCGPVAVAELPRTTTVSSVALVGPPNSGKTTLFNRLTGLRQKVANFPGVTVEQHTGIAHLPDGRSLHLIDLPGIYSLSPRSEDEQVAYDILHGKRADTPKPGAVLLVLDSTNLARHLMLAAPILSLGIPVLIILNMADDLRARGGTVDVRKLSEQLGAPVALIQCARRRGHRPRIRFSRRRHAQAAANATADPAGRAEVPRVGRLGREQGKVSCSDRAHLDEEAGPPLSAPRCGTDCLPAGGGRRDSYDLHGVGSDHGCGAEGVRCQRQMDCNCDSRRTAEFPDRRRRVAGRGKRAGVPAASAVPILFIGILEDSGYLARAALIADRTMARVGLQGKSFIPLLSAYGCAVPAIMSTRTIENKRDRMATILIAPFMTCSARLPVYALLIAAFIPNRPVIGSLVTTQVAALLALYILGFLAAVATAKLLKSSVLKSSRAPFLLEMPAYRWPTVQSLGLRLLDRAKVFLRRAGTVILFVMVILWVAQHLPYSGGQAPEIGNSVAGMIGHAIEPVIKPLGFNWKIGIGLLTSLAARETIVGTLGQIYGMDPATQGENLQRALHSDLSMGGAFALLIFFAFAMQCMSTTAVVRRETGGWKWPILQFAYMGALAYAGAFIAYHLIG